MKIGGIQRSELCGTLIDSWFFEGYLGKDKKTIIFPVHWHDDDFVEVAIYYLDCEVSIDDDGKLVCKELDEDELPDNVYNHEIRSLNREEFEKLISDIEISVIYDRYGYEDFKLFVREGIENIIENFIYDSGLKDDDVDLDDLKEKLESFLQKSLKSILIREIRDSLSFSKYCYFEYFNKFYSDDDSIKDMVNELMNERSFIEYIADSIVSHIQFLYEYEDNLAFDYDEFRDWSNSLEEKIISILTN